MQMKRMKLFSFRGIMLLLMSLMTFSLFAQTVTVSGTVIDDTGIVSFSINCTINQSILLQEPVN